MGEDAVIVSLFKSDARGCVFTPQHPLKSTVFIVYPGIIRASYAGNEWVDPYS